MSSEDRIFELETALERVLDLFEQPLPNGAFWISVLELDSNVFTEEAAIPVDSAAVLEDAFLTLYKEDDASEEV